MTNGHHDGGAWHRLDRQPSAGAERGDAADLLVAIGELSADLVNEFERAPVEDVAVRLVDHAPVAAAGVWLPDPRDGTWRRRTWRGVEVLPIGATALDRAVADAATSGDPVQLPGFDARSGWSDTSAPEPLTVALFPLTWRGLHGGAWILLTRRALTVAEMGVLAILARQVAAELATRAAHANGNDQAPATGEFVSLLTHELRTPLTALRGNLQLSEMAVRKGDVSRAERRLQAALQEIDAMTLTMQNLQDINHLERGKFSLAPFEADLVETVRKAIRTVQRAMSSPNHVIRLDGLATLPCVHDVDRMAHAFANLIGNAVSYAPDGGTIDVSVAREDDLAVISIRDQGIGILPEERVAIFRPYYRGVQARQVRAKGLGLGLTIAEATVSRSGGTIEVADEPGGGSTVTVRMPIAVA